MNSSTSSSYFNSLDNMTTTTHLQLQSHIIFMVANAVNLIVGLPTNSYVLWLIVTKSGLSVSSEFFALNLAVSDIFVCLFNVLVLLDSHFQHQVQMAAIKVFSVSLGVGRPLFQCCICLERYLAVVHPVVFLRYKPLRYRLGCVLPLWMLVLGFCVVISMVPRSIWFFFLLTFYIFIFAVKLFCCISVLTTLKRPGPGERQNESSSNVKVKAFKVILVIMLSMVCSYLPSVLTTALHEFLSSKVFFRSLSVCFFVTIITGFIQPLIYLHKNRVLPRTKCLN